MPSITTCNLMITVKNTKLLYYYLNFSEVEARKVFYCYLSLIYFRYSLSNFTELFFFQNLAMPSITTCNLMITVKNTKLLYYYLNFSEVEARIVFYCYLSLIYFRYSLSNFTELFFVQNLAIPSITTCNLMITVKNTKSLYYYLNFSKVEA